MARLNRDLENGNPKEEARRFASLDDDDVPQDEYTSLVRFITTYHEGRGPAEPVADEEDKCLPTKRHWWSGKAKDGGVGFETPLEWLETDMKSGLSSADVESRRKKTGWNELTTEKENPFLKFLGYFRGPILYGLFPLCPQSREGVDLTAISDGARSPPRRWSARLG
jgi:H+-transporting ATPase